MSKLQTAQKYIDSRNGTNKERDAKPEHDYYSSIIQDLLNQISNIKKMHKQQLKEAKEVKDV
tara:strand:- start:590 stop:775 length:186 start_codon:yes stop_codon:yes gene_type:complete